MSKLLEFVKENKNWKEVLSAKPYCLKIKEEGNYVLFMYNQLDSDFYNPIVKEARGIILSFAGKEPRVVCRAFDKFANYGEGYADDIDWSTAVAQEKVDGSIIKLWCDENQWHISTNSCIDAFKNAPSNFSKSFGEIFSTVFTADKYQLLDPDYTYMFELVSPYNRVVINYGETAVYALGKRNNKTEKEEPITEELGVKRPQYYTFESLEKCILSASVMNFDREDDPEEEGYVVVDKDYHRIKVKSPAYVAKHHLVTKNPSLEDLIRVYLNNENEEFLTYFPGYHAQLTKVIYYFYDVNYYLFKAMVEWDRLDHNRKEFARLYSSHPFSKYFFDAINSGDWSIKRVKSLPVPDLARYIKNFYRGDI